MLIEQLAITTTPKYSFPQPTINTSLPQRLTELSIHSLKHTQNQPFQLNQQYFQQNSPEQTQTTHTQLQPIPLKPRPEETMVTAVDTSTIKIGETTKGIVIAVRGATIWKHKRHYRRNRLNSVKK